MTLIDQLIAKAAAKRDASILLIEQDYESTVRRIRTLGKKLEPSKPKRLGVREIKAVRSGTPFRRLNSVQAAHAVLSEGKPMTLVELVVALQSRGCRRGHNPHRVLRTLRECFRYHRDKFVQDAEGRWSIS